MHIHEKYRMFSLFSLHFKECYRHTINTQRRHYPSRFTEINLGALGPSARALGSSYDILCWEASYHISLGSWSIPFRDGLWDVARMLVQLGWNMRHMWSPKLEWWWKQKRQEQQSLRIPSGNQTWQLKIRHLSDVFFPFKATFSLGTFQLATLDQRVQVVKSEGILLQCLAPWEWPIGPYLPRLWKRPLQYFHRSLHLAGANRCQWLGVFFYDVMGRMKIAKMWFLHPEHAHTDSYWIEEYTMLGAHHNWNTNRLRKSCADLPRFIAWSLFKTCRGFSHVSPKDPRSFAVSKWPCLALSHSACVFFFQETTSLKRQWSFMGRSFFSNKTIS